MKLLEDLEGKRPNETVTLKSTRHGKNAVQTLKRTLSNVCPELAGKIHKKGNTVFTDIVIKLEE